jgi:hypothetical protein
MGALSASDLLEVWERGSRLGPIGRALELVAIADPSLESPHLVSIGRRDALLLMLRERIFGPDISAVTSCIACGEDIEMNFRVMDVRVPLQREESMNVTIDGRRLSLRAPNSQDVEAALGVAPEEALMTLLTRCACEIGEDGISPSALPPALADRVSDYIAAMDPQAEISLSVTCPHCESMGRAGFDIVSFLWTEIAALAVHVLREVHTLASAYGWEERSILSMSAVRRRCYLDMVGA